MDTFVLLGNGLLTALDPWNLLYALIGVTLGTAVGATSAAKGATPPTRHPPVPRTPFADVAVAIMDFPHRCGDAPRLTPNEKETP